MGSATATVSSSPVKTFWQARPVKYTYPGGRFRVEELITPWDLYMEGALFGNSVGMALHQLLVKNQLERIFSLRSTDDGFPVCDIITRPEKAPGVSFSFSPRRVLNTSNPMIVDDQKLIVLDVVAAQGKRAGEPILNMVKEFYLSMGGRLSGEHPQGYVYTEKKDVKRWRKIIDADVLLDMVIATKPTPEMVKSARESYIHVPVAEVAIELLCMRYWEELHVHGDEPLGKEVIEWLLENPDDVPTTLSVYGHTDEAKELWAKIEKLYAEKVRKKK